MHVDVLIFTDVKINMHIVCLLVVRIDSFVYSKG